ncbi:IclR family transcriptional regulator [Streptomyces sp. NPDC047002]|uniref:IclR family transcriptional regulator n=1 Tax=Streptomyces sp. NPDC047002 TaxID=3155475 RepID=UPI003456E676
MEKSQRSDGGATAPSYPISSVDNALRLLLLFRDCDSVRLTEACAHLGVAHSTAHRLLAMLVHHGFVRQDKGTRTYRPGPTLVGLGLAVVQRMDVRVLVRPFLTRLSAEFEETIHLVELEGNQVRFLDSVESDRALRVAARTGKVLPAHCTSAGKALLAELSRDEVHALYPDGRLTGQTGQSLRSLRALEAALDEVRARGYATNFEESEEGVGSVAIALPAQAGHAGAAIAVAVPVSRLNSKVETHIVRALREVREELGEVMG